MVTYVPTDYLDVFYDKVSPFLDRAAGRSNGRYRGDDFWEMVKDGSHQLWVTLDDEENIVGVTSTTIYENRNLTVMEIIAHGGNGSLDRKYLSEVMRNMQEFAEDNNCDVIRIVGRRGWVKALKPYGYHSQHVVLEKEVTDARRRRSN